MIEQKGKKWNVQKFFAPQKFLEFCFFFSLCFYKKIFTGEIAMTTYEAKVRQKWPCKNEQNKIKKNSWTGTKHAFGAPMLWY